MISVVQLGTLDYAEGLRLQQKLVSLRKSGEIGDVLLLLEHAPVITLGRNAKSANILASPESLAARSVEVFECNRGGDVTFHGPGQLVGYPIFDLRSHSCSADTPFDIAQGMLVRENPTPRKTLGAVDYVRRLEERGSRRKNRRHWRAHFSLSHFARLRLEREYGSQLLQPDRTLRNRGETGDFYAE